MQVDSICNADAAPDPPRTPPREEAGANENPSEINDNAEENEATEDEEEEESASVASGKRRRVSKEWTPLEEWDATQFLASEIDAKILRVATERMEESGLVEWPSTRAKPGKSIGLWCLRKSYVKDLGQTTVETYYCPLSNRTKCPVQIRVIWSLTLVVLETSGGVHSQALCHAHDQSKKTQLQAADSSSQGCVNQSKSDADRCPQGAPTSQSERQNRTREVTVGAFCCKDPEEDHHVSSGGWCRGYQHICFYCSVWNRHLVR